MTQKKRKLKARRVKNKGGRPPGRKKPPTLFELPKFPTFEDLLGFEKSRKKKRR